MMKYVLFILLGLMALPGLAKKIDSQQHIETQRLILQELLAEDHISQLEYNQKMGVLRVEEITAQKELRFNPPETVNKSGPPGTASLSGTARVGGIAQIDVILNLRDFNTGAYVGFATTDGSGTYTITDLDAGDYYLVAESYYDEYINAIWSNTGTEACFACLVDAGNVITLADAEVRVNTDLDLEIGASVSGNIKEGLNNLDGLYLIVGTFYGANDFNYSVGEYTNPSGDYTVRGLPAGDYFVHAADPADDYIDAMWSTTGSEQCGQCIPDADNTLSLALAEVRLGVDMNLTIGAVLTGQIIDATTSAAVETLAINMYDTLNPDNYWNFITEFDGLGNYTVSGIPQGSWKVYLAPNNNIVNEYVPEIYNNIPCNLCSVMVFNGAGDLVVLTNGMTTAGIDFALQTGASVSGSIVNAAMPAQLLEEFALVYLFNETNRVISTQFLYGINNDPLFTGDYKIGGLLPGTYFAQGGDLGREFYQRELYNDIRCPWSGCDRGAGGVPIVLGANEQRLGIDFNLEYGGKISGTVTDAGTGNPISTPTETQYVQFYDAAGLVAGGAGILEDGTYTSQRAIPPGTYSVRTGTMFNGVFNSPYVMQKYDPMGNIDCPGVTCDLTTGNVTVSALATETGVDFALSPAFSFSGTITELGSPNPIPDVHVLVFDDSGLFANWATTDALGDFTVSGLPAGTYYALTNNGSNLPFMGFFPEEAGGWIDILFDGTPCPGSACDVTTGTPIVLGAAPIGSEGTGGLNLDFSLSAGGSITGQVNTLGTSLPAKYVNVNVYNSDGDFYGSYPSDDSGYYMTVGFPADTYYLTTSNDGALVNAKFGDEYCFAGSCEPLDAVPVVITGNQPLTGVDFNLRPDYVFKNGLD